MGHLTHIGYVDRNFLTFTFSWKIWMNSMKSMIPTEKRRVSVDIPKEMWKSPLVRSVKIREMMKKASWTEFALKKIHPRLTRAKMKRI
jgi:hypothetical protein